MTLSSSMYFQGNNMSKHRITKLWEKPNGDTYKKVHLRHQWVKYLKKNTIRHNTFNKEYIQNIIHWIDKVEINNLDINNMLNEIINNSSTRCNLIPKKRKRKTEKNETKQNKKQK